MLYVGEMGGGGSPGLRLASAAVKIHTSRLCNVRVVTPVYALVSDETCAIKHDCLMCSDVKQCFIVSVKNIHVTINIEKGVLLKIR
jgi:hypothetical protein